MDDHRTVLKEDREDEFLLIPSVAVHLCAARQTIVDVELVQSVSTRSWRFDCGKMRCSCFSKILSCFSTAAY